MKKSHIIILCAVGALILFIGGYLIANANGKAAVAEAKAQAEMDKAVALQSQIKDITAQREKSEALLVKVQADAIANERAFLTVLAQVKTATPAQLVDQGSQIVGSTDITLAADGKTVTMGVETYRQFVTMAVDDQQYKNVREPSWNAQEALYKDQIAGFKAEKALQIQKDAALAASIADLKDFISHTKTAGTLEKILWTGAGIGAGLLAGHLLK